MYTRFPDVKVNPAAADGFRSPSDYSADLVGPVIVDATYGGERYYGWPKISGHERYSGNTPMVLDIQGLPTPESVMDSWKNELRTKILVNLKDEILDVAMVLAEMQGTVDLIQNGLFRIARSMDAIKSRKRESYHFLMHGRTRDGRRPTDKFLRETASIFLEWKYGIMPTVYDVAGASQALDINDKGTLFNNPPLLTARTGLSTTSTHKVKGSVQPFAWPDADVSVVVKEQAAARVDYSISADGLRGLSRYGIGLGTVGTILFERTPFSFVLNMGFPLADMIKAWTSISAGCEVRGYTETFYVSYQVEQGRVSPFGDGRSLTWATAKSPVSQFIRNGGSAVPMPLPFVRNPIKTGNIASVLALFTQLRKS
jgi:hypothetical protein